MPDIYYNGKNPLKRLTPPTSVQYVSLKLLNLIIIQNLFRSSPYNLSLTNQMHYNKIQTEIGSMNLHSHHPRNEIWRSETVLTVLTDTWLYNDLVSQSMSTCDISESFTSNTMVHFQAFSIR